MSVATLIPTPPTRISGSDTVPLARSGLSVLLFSLARNSEMGRVKSRFHSSAFIARSRWPSKISCCLSISNKLRQQHHQTKAHQPNGSFHHRPCLECLRDREIKSLFHEPKAAVVHMREKQRAGAHGQDQQLTVQPRR